MRPFYDPTLAHRLAIAESGWLEQAANYPGEHKPWSRKAAGRKQKKFSKREAAEAFLEQAKREWIRKGGVNLAFDREAHYDFMRAMEVIAGTPNGTLEKAVLLYRMCVSSKERRDGGYEAPRERSLELSPRFFLLADHEARKRRVSVGEAVEAMMASWAEMEMERQVRERIRDEAREYKELLERNEVAKRELLQWEEADRLAKALGKESAAFEAGRRSVLAERSAYQREWRRKRKEARARSDGNGNSDLP